MSKDVTLPISVDQPVDMTRTMPPEISGLKRLIQGALAHVPQLPDPDHLIQRHHFFGTAGERSVAASWLSHRLGFDPGPDRLFVTGGTQNCLEILVPRLGGTRSCVATQMMSYA
ncbi:hypothetical protein [Bradyrhizobium genosp. P]|uniref:hypothetical protein n=1 Tax=Bradyrhizobium genosp. P TaxID=83641 RepID=UPI003CFA60B9